MYDYPIHSKNFPEVVPAFIEVQKNSNVKYEWDNIHKVLTLDRILHSSVVYPDNYGFIPQTLCGDGDPLDILVLCSQPLLPGTVVEVKPICYLDMTDEKGRDEKVVGIVKNDPHYNNINTMEDLYTHKRSEITEFFETYKKLEKNKWVKVGTWYNTEDTLKLICETHANYMAKV